MKACPAHVVAASLLCSVVTISTASAEDLFRLDGDGITDVTGRHHVAVAPDATRVTPSAETAPDGSRALRFDGGWLTLTNAEPESAADFELAPGEHVRLSFYFQSGGNGAWLDDANAIFKDRMHAFGFGGLTTNIDADFGDADTTASDPATTACWTFYDGQGIPAVLDPSSNPTAYFDNAWHHYVLERQDQTISVSIDEHLLGSQDLDKPIGSSDDGSPNYIGRESELVAHVSAALGKFPSATFPWFGLIAGVKLEDLGASAPPPTNDLAQEFLAEHNVERKKNCAPALTWSTTLAMEAQSYASHCVVSPDGHTAIHSQTPGEGENLAWGWGGTGSPPSLTPTKAVDGWYDEISSYDWSNPGDPVNFHDVGHFTQVVWRASTELGCGKAFCSNLRPENGGAVLYVCRYSPPGNVPGGYADNVKPDAAHGGCH